MIFIHCTKSTHAIGQNQSLVFLSPGNEFFECSIDNNARNVHYLFKMAINFAKIDEMKKNLTRLNTKQFLKVRKVKQSGALQFFDVNKQSKDVGVRYLN